MPRKRISSLSTFFYKFVFPPFYVLGAVNVARYIIPGNVFRGEPFSLVMMSLVAAIAVPVLVWLSFRANKVEIDDDFLYISNYRREIIIPLEDVCDAKEMRWIAPYWITLFLRSPSEFRDKIVFIPPYRLWPFWTANPLVEELKLIARSKQLTGFIRPIPEKGLFK